MKLSGLDGGIEIVGDTEELQALRWSIKQALKHEYSESALLTEDGITPVRIYLETDQNAENTTGQDATAADSAF